VIAGGPPTTGKTTALLQVGRACHLAEAARRGQGVEGWVPVAYVLVPPGASAKALAGEFARFLGVPVTARMTQTQIVDAVCHTYREAGVRLVAIDEIHRLNPRTTTGAEAVDLLKDLTERIGATFVFAGIDVVATALFSGVRGAQLAGRASLVECGAFPARPGTHEPFTELITGVEAALDLNAHRAGTPPPPLASYRHRPTAAAPAPPPAGITRVGTAFQQPSVTARPSLGAAVTNAGQCGVVGSGPCGCCDLASPTGRAVPGSGRIGVQHQTPGVALTLTFS
jgi:hypothetical protein